MVESRLRERPRRFWKRSHEIPLARKGDPDNGGIEARILTLADLFCDDFQFRLTCFQRSYAWRTQNVSRLLANIREAMAIEGPKRRYYLGRLMLAQKPGQAEAELVDGHQRLMTLTIVFAVLRDLEADEDHRAWLDSLVRSETADVRGRRAYRMSAQVTPSRYIEQMVQEPGGTELDPPVDIEELSDTERNIYENREYIRGELTAPEVTEDYRRQLADFLAHHCRVLAVAVDDHIEAWDMMQIEAETRLEFTEADQAKAVLLAAMPVEDRLNCSRLWEGCEASLSAEDMHGLLSHIRAIKWRGRTQSHKPVEPEIIAHFALADGGFAFMNHEFVPHAERLSAIRRGAVGSLGATRTAIAASIQRMEWIEQHAWVPAALQWIALRDEKNEEDQETLLFFRRLERLVWIMRIAGIDPGMQETRYLNLLGEIERWQKVDTMSRLQIERALQDTALNNLRSRNFAAKHFAGLILRRIGIIMGADPGPISRDKVTIEHILPRNPPSNGVWRRHFRSKEDVDAYSQRLGNLTLLSGPHNQKVGTLDWPGKKAVYATSNFVMSRKASEVEDWTVRTIANRTEDLIQCLFQAWDIDV